MKTQKKARKLKRRIIRVRKKIRGTQERPRLAVRKSLRHIYAQIIDDVTGKSLVQVSDLSPDLREEVQNKSKTETSEMVGKLIAEKAKEQGIERVVFDRHGNSYHGRVKAVAEGAREGGLKL